MFPKTFINKFKLDFLSMLFLSPALFLFLYKLGQSSLVSWDEAWYGVIARNILETGNLFVLRFNGGFYNDHPPAGFWWIALSIKLLGDSEFAVRLPSAIAGFLTLVFLYFLGKNLFNRWVGFLSAVSLTSAFWFLHRSREGDLDIFLTLFFVTTIYLAIKASKNYRFLIPFSVSLSLLILTKTFVPLTVFPTLLIIFLGSKNIFTKKIIWPLFIFLSFMLVWLYNEFKFTPEFGKRLLYIGLPGVQVQTSYLDNLKLMKDYLHNGIGRWFWPGVLGVVLGPLLFQRRFLILSSFCVAFFVPFLLSHNGQIWHLVPLYPFMILAFYGFSYVVLERLTGFLPKFKFVDKKEIKKYLPALAIGVFCFYYFNIQIKQAFYQFIDIAPYRSDEEVLSKEASKYYQRLYLDDDWGPAAAYYSKKTIYKLESVNLEPLFDDPRPFILITHQWRLDGSKVPVEKYQILKKDRDKVLVLRR